MRYSGRATLLASIAASAACIDDVDDREVARASAALTPVTWTDQVGVSAPARRLRQRHHFIDELFTLELCLERTRPPTSTARIFLNAPRRLAHQG